MIQNVNNVEGSKPVRQPAALLDGSVHVAEVCDRLVLGGELEDALQARVVPPVLLQHRVSERRHED